MTCSISTHELLEKLTNPELALVDARPSAAYNGWKLQSEAGGGHIRGAVSFPLSWTEIVTGADLIALLASKGITSDRSVVVYGYGQDESDAMAAILTDFGYTEVRTYDPGPGGWAADDHVPLARLPNYQKLVHPMWLRQLISGENPETYRGRGFIVIDVGSGEARTYDAGHIPGAVSLDTDVLEEAPLWNRVSDERLEGVLIAHGITYDKTVVLYGRDTTAAARAACLLMYAGVGDVRLLDGGLDAWTSAGYDLETETHEPVPAEAFGWSIPGHPEYMVDTEELHSLLSNGETHLVDVRSWAEYIGETSGYDYIEPKGRIAGAIWGHSGSDPHHMQHYRNVDNTMCSYHEIASHWRDSGVTSEGRIVFYCGTGWRASQAFFSAHLLGWTNIAVYDGGWLEWSQDGRNPVERGAPIRSRRAPTQPG